jgi:1,2-diacylglycerol 3-beta-galactosyltransferase
VKKLDFIYFDAGGGHRSAANALRQVIERQQRPWEVRMVNLQEVLDPLDIFRKLTGLRLQDVYNLTLKKGWTLGSPKLLKGMHAILRLYLPAQVRTCAVSGRRTGQRWWSPSCRTSTAPCARVSAAPRRW